MTVDGHEDSGSEIYAHAIAMEPVTTEYRLSLEPKTEIDLKHLETAVNRASENRSVIIRLGLQFRPNRER